MPNNNEINKTTFVGAIEGSSSKHLLLGNGFGLALDFDRFNFRNLFEKAEFSPELIGLTGNNSEGLAISPDFEGFLKILRDADLVSKYLGSDISDKIEGVSEEVRDGLTKAVHSIHKHSEDGAVGVITNFSVNQVISCGNFLKNFSQRDSIIFTLNYDMLLYRVLMEIKNPNSSLEDSGIQQKIDENGLDVLKNFGDGFTKDRDTRRLEWRDWATSMKPRICFLHGALHLFKKGSAVEKIEAQGFGLLEEIETQISDENMPLIVCEGAANRKKFEISENAYLRDCYNKLGSIDGDIFVIGSSISNNDNHIWAQIDKNERINHVYIGCHEERAFPAQQTVIEGAFKNKISEGKVFIFDSSIVPIWGEATS